MVAPVSPDMIVPQPRPRSGRRVDQQTPVMQRKPAVSVKLREPELVLAPPVARATSADRDVIVIHSGDADEAAPDQRPRTRSRRRVRTPTTPMHGRVTPR